MSEQVIKFNNVSKIFRLPHERRFTLKQHFLGAFKKTQFENLYALHNVSFSVEKGECLGVIGCNGSGKSTLLRSIGGIYNPDKGKIYVKGTVAPFIELGVGFQYDLSGKDNVYLYGAILGLSRREINSAYQDIVEFAGLSNFMDQKLRNYSSGMQVRLAFSIIAHTQADILLIDEVLAVGDQDFQQKCFAKINDFKKQGKTIVFVSHNLDQVKNICDRVMWLDKGKIKVIDRPQKVVDLYLNNIS